MNSTIKPIRTAEDYEYSLELLGEVLDAVEGTPEADRLEVLSVLIEDYEKRHHPIAPPTPVEAIKFRMEQSSLKPVDLIPYIGSRGKVSEVLSGKKELTLKMIRALHEGLVIPLTSLVGASNKELPSGLEGVDFEKFPLKEMISAGYFEGIDGIRSMLDKFKDHAEELIRVLVQAVGGEANLPQVAFRKNDSMRINAKFNKYALTAWCMAVLKQAKSEPVTGKYDTSIWEDDRFVSSLVSLSQYPSGIKTVQEHLRHRGIRLVYVPHLKNTHLDGASFMLNGKEPVIAITGRYDRLDNFWFVLLHELGHIKLHFGEGRTYFIDDISLRDGQDDAEFEKQADDFAQKALLTDAAFEKVSLPNLTASALERFADSQGISPAIVAGRWQHTFKNYRKFSNFVGQGEVRKWFESK